jgi:hypothetical protein
MPASTDALTTVVLSKRYAIVTCDAVTLGRLHTRKDRMPSARPSDTAAAAERPPKESAVETYRSAGSVGKADGEAVEEGEPVAVSVAVIVAVGEEELVEDGEGVEEPVVDSLGVWEPVAEVLGVCEAVAEVLGVCVAVALGVGVRVGVLDGVPEDEPVFVMEPVGDMVALMVDVALCVGDIVVCSGGAAARRGKEQGRASMGAHASESPLRKARTEGVTGEPVTVGVGVAVPELLLCAAAATSSAATTQLLSATDILAKLRRRSRVAGVGAGAWTGACG